MSNGISNIVINPDQFYHKLKEEAFDRVILSGGLKSVRMRRVRNGFWNGYDFISLDKKIDRIGNFTSPDYSYECLIDRQFLCLCYQGYKSSKGKIYQKSS